MPAFQRGAGQSAAHLRVRLNHGASDITQSRRPSPIRCVPSRSLAAAVRPRRVRDRSRAPLFLPLAPSSLFLFTPLSHSFSLSRPRARSTSSLSFSLLSLRISPSPSSHLVESRLFPTLVLFFFSRQCGVTACFAARNACVATCVPLSFLLSLSLLPSVFFCPKRSPLLPVPF